MAEGYTDTPLNMADITPYVIVDKGIISAKVLEKQKCFFYDACSFRRHANLNAKEADYLLKYIEIQNGIVVITRCILMELASRSGILNGEYVEYIKYINGFGIDVLVMYEEDLFSVMGIAFSANTAINGYLCWAVRMIKEPVSTITETLEKDSSIHDEVIKGKKLDRGDVYKHFFQAVRGNKEPGDNLGEELLAVCLHILSHMPGRKTGSFV